MTASNWIRLVIVLCLLLVGLALLVRRPVRWRVFFFGCLCLIVEEVAAILWTHNYRQFEHAYHDVYRSVRPFVILLGTALRLAGIGLLIVAAVGSWRQRRTRESGGARVRSRL